MDIPAGTKHDDQIKLHGYGAHIEKKKTLLSISSMTKGDLVVVVRIAKANSLTKDQIKQLKELMNELGDNKETIS